MVGSRAALIAALSLASLSLGAAAAPPTAGAPLNEAEDAKHGAVLCSWAILLDVQFVGDRCYSGQDVDFRQALSQSISRIDAFIVVNGPSTPEAVQRQHRAPEQEFACRDVCRVGDAVQFYQG